MALALYSTLSRKKEAFEPLNPGRVGMYVCGPTVYDYAHIGNARPVVVFDVLYRLLRNLYGAENVVYVRNITDVDDKINDAARKKNVAIDEITARTTEIFHQDMAALNALTPDVEPKATAHIPEMISLTQTLIEKGHAYVAQDHVLFDVSSMKDYGRLSRRNREEMIAGARVEVAPYKKDPSDFVLWKPSEEGDPGWQSPWGRGRPGWHLECSAMSGRYLGETFDIHGGGQDLIFPHHENEIAQSRCAHGAGIMAKYWLHNGYLMAEGEKMSKSLGNFYTVHDLLKEFPGEAVRLALLQTHYRQPQDFTKEALARAKSELDRFYGALRNFPQNKDVGETQASTVSEALQDDLNTPLALTRLHEILSALNKATSGEEQARLRCDLVAGGRLLGLLQQDPERWLHWRAEEAKTLGDAEIDQLVEARTKARKDKDFARSDEIRDQLADLGVILEDAPEGTIWRRV
jgi:cysteinyl-tRNA synthetase